MQTLSQDLLFGVRMLRKQPGFTLIALLTLALGIGANTAMFSLVRAAVFVPLPVTDAEQLVSVFTTDARNPGNLPVSHYNFRDYREQQDVFASLTAFSTAAVSLSDEQTARQLLIEVVAGNYFDVLGVRATWGRTFTSEEDQAEGAHPVVVLSYGFWQSEFGGANNIIGKTITLNRHSFTVLGVAPQGFNGIPLGGAPALWVPMAMHNQVQPQIAPRQPPYNERRGLFLSVFGRLKPGVTLQQAQASLSTLASRLEQEFPNDNRGRNVRLRSLLDARLNPDGSNRTRFTVIALMAVAGIVLLIACANVANLLLTRATARRKEIAIRLALGASRAQIIRQLLTESLLLAVSGGLLGLLVAFSARRLWQSQTLLTIGNVASNPGQHELDPLLLGFALLSALFSGVLFGLLPAWQASRPDLATTLKNETAPTRRRTRLSVQQALVIAQIALSLLALVGAGLFIRTLQNALAVNPGFHTENVLLLNFNLAREGYNNEQGRNFQRLLTERVRALPGVQGVTFALAGPLAGSTRRTVFIEGREADAEGRGPSVPTNSVAPDFFATLDIPILRGRAFAESDHETAPPVAIINEAMAHQFWPGQEAVGNRFRFSGESFFRAIIGVARDAKYGSLTEARLPFAYISLRQNYAAQFTLHVRTARDVSAITTAVREQVRALDARLPILAQQTVQQRLNSSVGNERANALLLGVFGALALLLAVIGLYGVISYTVAQRTRDIGIRMALGAQKGAVLRLVIAQGAKLTLAGVTVGLLSSLLLTRWLASLLFGVSATDALTFVLVPVILFGVALLACYLPARRATKVDPLVAIRCE